MPIVVSSTEDLATVLADLRERLNKTTTADDVELGQMIDAAVAEYVELIGPLTGTVVEKASGGQTSIILSDPRATALTSVVYTDGTVVDVADLDLDTATGILHWGYNTAGSFTYGSRNVVVTYTVSLPDNHREAIIADVAGYFAATQRGAVTGALPTGYEASYEDRSTPLVLFPRIRALASRYSGIA